MWPAYAIGSLFIPDPSLILLEVNSLFKKYELVPLSTKSDLLSESAACGVPEKLVLSADADPLLAIITFWSASTFDDELV